MTEETLSLEDVRALGVNARRRLALTSKKVLDLPVAQAAATRPSYCLDVGVTKSRGGPPRLQLTVHTKTGPAIDIAKDILSQNPRQVELLRREPGAFDPKAKRLSAEAVARLRKRHRPLTIGQCISHITGANGSLGCFVEVDGAPGILSASHVIAKSGRVPDAWIAEDNQIYQPGCQDKDSVEGADLVATLDPQHFSVLREPHQGAVRVAQRCFLGPLPANSFKSAVCRNATDRRDDEFLAHGSNLSM